MASPHRVHCGVHSRVARESHGKCREPMEGQTETRYVGAGLLLGPLSTALRTMDALRGKRVAWRAPLRTPSEGMSLMGDWQGLAGASAPPRPLPNCRPLGSACMAQWPGWSAGACRRATDREEYENSRVDQHGAREARVRRRRWHPSVQTTRSRPVAPDRPTPRCACAHARERRPSMRAATLASAAGPSDRCPNSRGVQPRSHQRRSPAPIQLAHARAY